ncbi:hypothetical protein HDU91_006635 [Kappamyces sp. JEL0680]|nr:hypothetical protein HDU91_006635 [Kappamyces sp. JEL0680]
MHTPSWPALAIYFSRNDSSANLPVLGQLLKSALSTDDSQVCIVTQTGQPYDGSQSNDITALSCTFHETQRGLVSWQTLFVSPTHDERIELVRQFYAEMVLKHAIDRWGCREVMLPAAKLTLVRDLEQTERFDWVGETHHLYALPVELLDERVAGPPSMSLPDGFRLDVLSRHDVDLVLANQTVPYTPGYIAKLVTEEPFCGLNACVRDKAGRAVSWCLTHTDFSTGLISTAELCRGKGLAKKVVLQVVHLQTRYFQQCPHFAGLLRPFAFVKYDNEASAKLMASCGYRRTEDGECVWAGLHVANSVGMTRE